MCEAEIIIKQQKELEFLKEENRLLRQKIDMLSRQMFGKKSEKLSPGQMEMLLCSLEASEKESEASVEESVVSTEAPKKKKTRQNRRPRMPENLPVEEIIIDPEEVDADPSQWRQIGEEVSEQIDYEPGRFICRRTVRRTWVKRKDPDAVPVTAPLPPKLLDRSIMAPGLLAHVVVGKYIDHLPLYRQQQIFKQRHGVDLGRNTLCRGVELVADWLKPVAHQMMLDQIRNGYVQLDETPVAYLKPGNGKTAKGYFWTMNVPGSDTVYHWAPGRGYEHLRQWLPDEFNCLIQTDEYRCYSKLNKELELPAHARCWAHARRKFMDALKQGEDPRRVGWIIHQIGLLYRIEKRLREKKAGPALREAVRQSESRPIIDRLFKLWKTMQLNGTYKPQTLTGKALAYALGIEDGLNVYMAHGQVEIDNNLAENSIRPITLGRKNWMFIGDKEAGWRSAVIYTILQSCKNHGINPTAYLKDVLDRLPNMTNQQIHQITPRAWADEQRQPIKLAS